LGQPPIANDPLGEILKGNFFVTHCFLWPRQILLKLGGWDAMLASWQDIDLVFRAVLDGAPFEFVPGSEVYHRVGHNDASVSSVRTLESLKSRIRVLERVLKELDRRGELEKYRKLIADRFYWLARQFASHQSSEAENCFRRFLELSPDGHVPGPARRIRSLLQANRFERAHGN
jgi:GT2 family glycosyltransferase